MSRESKPKIEPAVIAELRAIVEIETQEPGRVQRGISWSKDMDSAVSRVMDATGIDRSKLVQLAVARFLGVETPKAPARHEGNHYEPLGELEPA